MMISEMSWPTNLTKDERIAVQTKLIEAIKRHAIQGVAITVDPTEYATFSKRLPFKRGLYDSAYAFCAQVIMTGVSVFIERNPQIEKMAYFFEAGHSSAPQADEIMRTMLAQPAIKQQFRYAAHAFVEKRDAPQIQAADLLAWQWYTDRRHTAEERARRKECASLLQLHHNAVHIDSKELDRIANESIMIADLFGKQAAAEQSS